MTLLSKLSYQAPRVLETLELRILHVKFLAIFSIIMHFIKDAKREMESKKQIEGEEEGILRKFLKVNEDAAVAVVSDFLVAGVDTVSINVYFINWIIYSWGI